MEEIVLKNMIHNYEVFTKYHWTEAQEKESERIAIERFNSGEKPSYSTGICENITCGYGRLDPCGYWEFPLYPKTTPEAFAMFNKE